MANIMVLGSGSFGTSLAILAQSNGHQVTLWSYSSQEVQTLNKDREHKKLLPGIKIHPDIFISDDLNLAKEMDLIVTATPSFAVREVAKKLGKIVTKKTVIANVAKGIDGEKLISLSEVILEEVPQCRVVALSGPSHAEEVAQKKATSIVAASLSLEAAESVQEWLSNVDMRIYVNSDIVGVELGGALKNIIALAAGILDGMELGDNAKAALMTRGMKEITRLGIAKGADPETFSGLSGIGDLIVTCTSMHSRNRRAGILIGQGTTPKEAIEKVGTVEGYTATKAAYLLAKKLKVEMPIVTQLYGVLFGDTAIGDVVSNLMSRPSKHESESHWMNH